MSQKRTMLAGPVAAAGLRCRWAAAAATTIHVVAPGAVACCANLRHATVSRVCAVICVGGQADCDLCVYMGVCCKP